MKITRKQFQAFERVRESGVTNMFDIRIVSMLSDLDREKILAIIHSYDKLVVKYPGVRKEIKVK